MEARATEARAVGAVEARAAPEQAHTVANAQPLANDVSTSLMRIRDRPLTHSYSLEHACNAAQTHHFYHSTDHFYHSTDHFYHSTEHFITQQPNTFSTQPTSVCV